MLAAFLVGGYVIFSRIPRSSLHLQKDVPKAPGDLSAQYSDRRQPRPDPPSSWLESYHKGGSKDLFEGKKPHIIQLVEWLSSERDYEKARAATFVHPAPEQTAEEKAKLTYYGGLLYCVREVGSKEDRLLMDQLITLTASAVDRHGEDTSLRGFLGQLTIMSSEGVDGPLVHEWFAMDPHSQTYTQWWLKSATHSFLVSP